MSARRRRAFVGAVMAAAVFAPPRAAAEEHRLVTTSGALPFSSDELERAIAIRLQNVVLDAPIEVRALGADAVELIHRSQRRVVSLLGQRGAAAARRVALAIADLVKDELIVPLSELPPIETTTVTATAPAEVEQPKIVPLATPVIVEATPQPSPYTITALAAFGGFERATLSGALEGSLHLTLALRALAGAGVAWMPAATRGDVNVSSIAFPLRAGLAWRFDGVPLEARAGLVWKLISLGGGDGDRSIAHTDQVFGAGGSILYFWTLSPSFDLALALGADVYASRREFTVHDIPMFATDRVAIWGGAGIAFGGAR